MKLLIDENVPRAVARSLAELGHDVRTPDAGSSDAVVAERARKEKRVLVTLDKDFANILRYPPQEYCGIVCVRIGPPIADRVAAMLAQLLERFDGASIRGTLIILTAAGYRAYPPDQKNHH